MAAMAYHRLALDKPIVDTGLWQTNKRQIELPFLEAGKVDTICAALLQFSSWSTTAGCICLDNCPLLPSLACGRNIIGSYKSNVTLSCVVVIYL